MMCTQVLGHCQALEIGRIGQARDNDLLCTRFPSCNHAGQALLARPLNHHTLPRSYAPLQVGPLNAIGHGQGKSCILWIQTIWHPMKHRVDIQFHVLAVAAP